MNTHALKRFGILLPCLMGLAAAGTLHAGLVATNEGVPAAMNATGGTEGNPSIYRYDNYSKHWGTTGLAVGNASGANWVQLEVLNGSQIATTGTVGTINRIGGDTAAYTSQFARVVVSGAGSSLSLGTTRLGGMSGNNSLVFENGAAGTLSGLLYFGFNDTPVSTNNVLIVDNATLSTGANRIRVGYGAGHNYDRLIVRNGGTLTLGERLGVRYGHHSDLMVIGAGSSISVGYATANAIGMGESTSFAHHNTVTVADGGLVKLTQSGGTISFTENTTEGGSGVRFAAGVFAVAGNRTTHIPYTRARLWDGEAWVPAVNGWVGTYYANETAAAAAGFSGLGGYTVFTGGEPLALAPTVTVVVIK